MAVFNCEIWPPLIGKLTVAMGSVIGARVAWIDDVNGSLVPWGVLVGTVGAVGAVGVPPGECSPEQRLVWCFPLHLWQWYLNVQCTSGGFVVSQAVERKSQPRPQSFSLKKWVAAPLIFLGISLGDEVDLHKEFTWPMLLLNNELESCWC